MKTLIDFKTKNHSIKIIYNPRSTGMMLSSWKPCYALRIYLGKRRVERTCTGVEYDNWVTKIYVIRFPF
jgi:hypothetical protein